jgi:methionine aminotransferase
VTGWKVGYVAAPAALTAEFRKVHQFNVFTVNTPVQHGLAQLHGRPRGAYLDLPAFYQRKRDLFRAGLRKNPLQGCCPPRAPTSSALTSLASAT